MTPAERMLWNLLRNGRMDCFHFRRQQIIAGFIVDFYCHSANLIIELDGAVHTSNKETDHERETILQAMGFRVLRFWNDEVFRNPDEVFKKIEAACRANDLTSPPPAPPPPLLPRLAWDRP